MSLIRKSNFGISGRVNNPEFLKEVSSSCNKENRFIVVICLFSRFILKLGAGKKVTWESFSFSSYFSFYWDNFKLK